MYGYVNTRLHNKQRGEKVWERLEFYTKPQSLMEHLDQWLEVHLKKLAINVFLSFSWGWCQQNNEGGTCELPTTTMHSFLILSSFLFSNIFFIFFPYSESMKCKSGYYTLYRFTNALKIPEKFMIYITEVHKWLS